jgi:RNA polymerase sigma-70 factor (ECF subfamily)
MNEHVKKLWKESFKGFYKKHSRSLWFYIYKTCGDEHMADDILQEAFYRYLKAEPFRLNEFQQKAYLYKTAYRLIIDHVRKVKTEQNYMADFAENPVLSEEGYETGKEREVFMAMDMEKIFHLLKPEERNLLWLAYVEGYSHSEIAGITGSREKSIRVMLFRVKKKFSGILRQKGYTGEAYNEKRKEKN